MAKNQLVVTDNNLNELQVIGLNGLTSASQVVLSPDLKDLYVTEPGIGNVIVFARNTSSGVLTPTPVQTVFVGTNLTAALAINNAGTQVALGGSGGLKEYVRNSNGTLSFSNSAFQTNSITGVADVAYSQDGIDLYAVSPTTSTFAAFVASNLSFGPDVSFSGSTNGMVGASNIAVSHDDQYIYVIGAPGQTLAVIHHPNFGNWFITQVLEQGVNGVGGLVDANGVLVSNDSSPGHPEQDEYVYVTGGSGNSLAVFQRQPNGTLLPVQVLRGTPSLDDVSAIAEDGSGDVYVTSQPGIGIGGIGTFVPTPPIFITAASLVGQYGDDHRRQYLRGGSAGDHRRRCG